MATVGGNAAWSVFNGAPIALLQAMGLQAASESGTQAAAQKFYREWILTLSTNFGRGSRRAGGYSGSYTDILRTVKVSGSWRVIPVAKRFIPHTPSAPGDPPARDTGKSVQSIGIERENATTWAVFTTSKSLLYLEYGVGGGGLFGPHRAGIVIQPRPHARRTLEKVADGLTQDVAVVAYAEMVNTALRLRLSDQFFAIRKALVGISENLGWLQSLGLGGPWVGQFRRGILKVQRGLADADAVMKQELGARLVRRAVGHYAGRTIGETARQLAPGSGGGARFARRLIRNYYGKQAGGVLRRLR